MNGYKINYEKLNTSTISFKEQYNWRLSFPKDKSHSLEDISCTTGIPLSILQQVYNRGSGAWSSSSSSVRSKSGKKSKTGFSLKNRMSKEQWSHARVYGFVMSNPKQVGEGKPDHDLYIQLRR